MNVFFYIKIKQKIIYVLISYCYN